MWYYFAAARSVALVVVGEAIAVFSTAVIRHVLEAFRNIGVGVASKSASTMALTVIVYSLGLSSGHAHVYFAGLIVALASRLASIALP